MVGLNGYADAPRDAAGLLAEAGAAGLLVWRDGDRLRVRGPVAASHLARRLLADKAAVLSVLDARDAPARRPHRWRRPPTPWCPYGHPDGWISVFGPHVICAACHPPTRAEIVADRVPSSGPAVRDTVAASHLPSRSESLNGETQRL
ncbi:hypothetical protein [Alienimonas sp. DA493]|uniref:hypothetical protein n=1 Tax=Alienimonas sp. DA493 TaxID=3373605 RepID=UPI0037549D07